MAVITLSFFLFAGGLLRYGALSRAAAAVVTGAEAAGGAWTPRRLLSWNWLIGALCVLMMVLTAMPLIAENRIESATRLAREGKDLAAVGREADTAHKFNPLDGEPLILKALAVQAAGNVDEAERLILMAIDLEPYNDKYYRNLTRIYIQKGDGEEAAWAITRSRQLNPLESRDTGPLEEEVRKINGGKL